MVCTAHRLQCIIQSINFLYTQTHLKSTVGLLRSQESGLLRDYLEEEFGVKVSHSTHMYSEAVLDSTGVQCCLIILQLADQFVVLVIEF